MEHEAGVTLSTHNGDRLATAHDEIRVMTTKTGKVALLATLLLGSLAVMGCSNKRPNSVAPEDAARAWAQKLDLPLRGAACTMFDSDGDGYVSCVLALNGPDKVYFQGLQCGEIGSTLGGGCKPDAKNPEIHLAFELATKQAPIARRAE